MLRFWMTVEVALISFKYLVCWFIWEINPGLMVLPVTFPDMSDAVTSVMSPFVSL